MCLLAAFDLGDQFPFGFGKGAQTAGKAFPPFGLLVLGAARAFARAYAEKETDGLARPLIEDGFVEDLRGRVVGGGLVGVGEAVTFVLEGGCSYSDLFEGQFCRRCCTASLPYGTFRFNSGLRSGGVGSKEDVGACAFRVAFQYGCDGTAVPLEDGTYMGDAVHTSYTSFRASGLGGQRQGFPWMYRHPKRSRCNALMKWCWLDSY